jgi:hypothetical protein
MSTSFPSGNRKSIDRPKAFRCSHGLTGDSAEAPMDAQEGGISLLKFVDVVGRLRETFLGL